MKTCINCPSSGTVTYVGGTVRCAKCSDEFNVKNRAERLARETKQHICQDCHETFIGQYECPHCCDHNPDPDEGYHCLNCGTDCAEDVMSRAYDRAKDIRKYGE